MLGFKLQGFRLARMVLLAGVSAFALAAPAIMAPALAAKKPAAPAAPVDAATEKKNEQAAARQAYEGGVKSYSAGRFQPAIDQFSSALRGGGLAAPEMAKALYLRGVAYKKQNRPGLAISDLTSALWLKGGLSEADRQAATAERAEAYRMAGLSEGNSGAEAVAVADPTPATAPAAVSSAPAVTAAAPVANAKAAAKAAAKAKTAAAAAPPVEAPAQVLRQDPNSERAQEAAAARRLAAQPMEINSLHAAAASNVVPSARPQSVPTSEPIAVASAPATIPGASAQAIPAPIPQQAQVAAAMPAPAANAPAAAQGSAVVAGLAPADQPVTKPADPAPSSSVSSFLSNIFGGGSQQPAPANSPSVTTASTGPAATAPPAAAPANWGNTSVATAGPATAAKTVAPVAGKAAAPAVAAATPATKALGKYKLHIAAVRSREEADALAQKLMAQHGPTLASHQPVVDEAVIGSMGKFFRVRIGGYQTQDEPRGVCNKLRTSGFDCLVVTN